RRPRRRRRADRHSRPRRRHRHRLRSRVAGPGRAQPRQQRRPATMTAVPVAGRRERVPRPTASRIYLLLALVIVGTGVLLRDILPWTLRLPDAWVVPVADWVTAVFDW